MKTKLSKRDIIFFLLGLFSMFLIDVIWNWDDHVADFKRGFKDGYNTIRNE